MPSKREGCRLSSQRGGPRFPIGQKFVTAIQYVLPGCFEVAERAMTFDGVARTARGNQVFRRFLPFFGARMNEVYGHDQGILKTRYTVETAILATVEIPLENFAALLRGQRFGQTG